LSLGELRSRATAAIQTERGKLVLQRIQDVERQTIASAVPLYRGGGHRRSPDLIGTGFPIHIGARKMLLTAAHVVACLEDEHFYIPSGASLTPFDCRVRRIGTSGGNRHDDEIDLALIDLDEEQSNRLSRYRLIQIDEMESANFVNDAQALYSFVGYPASKNKADFRASEITPTLMPFRGMPIGVDEYTKFGRRFETHLITEFDEKRTIGSNGFNIPPSPKGLSGGPVWILGRLPNIVEGSPKPLLAGMGIENKRGGLVAVRTWVLLQIMRRIYPDLRELTEEAPGFRMNIPDSVPNREVILTRR
jgi:hypothetical protein